MKNIYFIHGLMGTGESHFKEQMDRFKKEYNVLPIDLPGHGQNAQDAEDPFFEPTLEWLMKELRKTGPGYIIGLSMGASFALHLAIRYPELTKGIVLTGYVPTIPKHMHATMEKQYHYLHTIKEEVPETATEYLFLHGGRWEDTLHKVVKCFTYHYPDVSDQQIKELTVPTFIVNGGKEQHEVDSVHHLSSLNKRIRPEIIPDGGHLANMEYPSLFNELTLRFIHTIEKSTSIK
ncbi:alpha/beta hydrolase [Bacillus sp. RO3]|nr:alpha/beta hydrolase [Bacillus sp. RO3]